MTETTNEAIASRLSCELDAVLPINPDSERKQIVHDQVLAVLSLAYPPTTICTWKQWEADHDTWATSCGDDFTLTCESPDKHGLKFCCYCGKSLKAEFSDPDWDNENV